MNGGVTNGGPEPVKRPAPIRWDLVPPAIPPRRPEPPPPEFEEEPAPPPVRTEIAFTMEEEMLLELEALPETREICVDGLLTKGVEAEDTEDAPSAQAALPEQAGAFPQGENSLSVENGAFEQAANAVFQELESSGPEEEPAAPPAAAPPSDGCFPAGAEPPCRRERRSFFSRRGKETVEPRVNRGRRVRRRLLSIACALLTVFVLSLFGGFAVIQGDSMEPVLSENDVLLYAKRAPDIQRGDILLFRAPGYGNQLLVKRVIGLPGDTIEVDAEGHVLLNGELLREDSAIYGASSLPGDVQFPIQVREGCYFVLGDNRASSMDSRMSVIGQVTQDEIRGRVAAWIHFE